MRNVGQYNIREGWYKRCSTGFMIRNFFKPDAYQLLLWAIHEEWEELE